MKPIFKILAAVATLVVLVPAVLVIRAVTVDSHQVEVEPTTFEGSDAAVQRLSEAVRFRTISISDRSKMDMDEFARFNTFLVESYPAASAAMERELVEPCSVIYTWPGKDANAPPVLFAAHTDVVPVEPHEVKQWSHPPFSGAIADGYVWGRGTLDDKTSVLGLMEAAELLATANRTPSRTIVFAFGCDEEVGGTVGAKKMSGMFAKRGLEFEFALDEGLAVTEGYAPGTNRPVGVVGIAEKGFATYVLTAEYEGGHSSMPAQQSAIGILSQAIVRLEQNRMPARLNPASRAMLETLAPEMDFGMRIGLANLWLLESVVIGQMTSKPATNAATRTTTAVTMMNAGVQDNVLAKRAEAKVNFRLMPGDSMEDVRRHIVDTIDDERISVEFDKGSDFGVPASDVSDVDTAGFSAVRDSIRATFGNEVVVAPGLTLGGTDVRHYQAVSRDQYRFAPLVMRAESQDTARVHGIDERISTRNFKQAVAFYAEVFARM